MGVPTTAAGGSAELRVGAHVSPEKATTTMLSERPVLIRVDDMGPPS
jgi:hypothetical protein